MWKVFDFPTFIDRIQSVEIQIFADCQNYGFNDDELFAIKLALHEALVNAVKHGNNLNPQKIIRVSYILQQNILQINVADEGNGFDPEKVPDPRENIEIPSGRGIFLMREYMTSVVFNSKGNAVTMTKKLSGDNIFGIMR